MEVEKRSDATMPAPYSYDLRQKAIEAVKGGERKSEECRMFNSKPGTIKRSPIFKRVVGTKSPIGNVFKRLLNNMVVKLKGRWLRYGERG